MLGVSFLVTLLLLETAKDAQVLAYSYSNYSETNKLEIRIGLVYEPNVDPVSGLATLMLAEQNLRTDDMLPSWVSYKYFQRAGCDLDEGLGPAIDLMFQDDVHVVFGPGCDSALVPLSRLAAGWKLGLGVFGYASTASSLTNEDVNPSFARTTFPNDRISKAVVNMLVQYKWQTVALVRNDDESCDDFMSALNEDLQQTLSHPDLLNISASDVSSFDFSTLQSENANVQFRSMRTRARVFIFCPGPNPRVARPFLAALVAENMTTHEYVWIMPSLLENVFDTQPPWTAEVGTKDGLDDIVKQAYKRVILIDQRSSNASVISAFTTKLITLMAANPLNHSVSSLNASGFVANLHDAGYLYGMAVNRCISQQFDFRNGLNLTTVVSPVKFTGVTGPVRIDDLGDRDPIFNVRTFDSTGSFTVLYQVTLNVEDNYGWRLGNFTRLRPEFWDTPDGTVPDDTPVCGFMNDECVRQENDGVIIGCVVGGIVILSLIIIFTTLRLRQMSMEQQTLNMAWKVERHEIHRITKGRVKAEDGSTITTSSASGSEISASNKSTESQSASLGSKNVNAMDDNGILLYNRAPFIGVGDYRDQRVAVKQIRQFQSNFSFSRKDLITMRAIKEFRHENLNTFLGMVVNSTPALVLWTYCQRGSLEDILFNEHIELDMMFKSSMMRDMVKGLDHLHRSIVVCHGALTTTNCVVDARWVLKLTDFGLHDILRKVQIPSKSLNEVEDHVVNQSMYHMSPEILRQAFEKRFTVATKEADMYALGIVLFQILYREQPFTNMNISPSEIIRKVAYPGPSFQLLRPVLPKRSGINHGFSVLLNLCWDETPNSRPSVSSVKESVYALTKQYSANIIDHVIKIMEQYTQNLEKVVEERTKELEAERMKADLLLKEMLPRTIADDLKAGKAVPPETYELATIYFSDIPQFIHLCGTSTPLDIVNMLNQLYSGFDAITKIYDVYKVETIGDAYMVASGLPVRNGVKNVTEIANMALHLRKFVATEFVIPHRPAEKLEIRIGFHTGAAAAGVIGLAMPRYCVFGDTVNTASRMESTGEPMKIQISSSSAKFLETRREYLLERRGMIEVKGKGTQETYWLLDRIPIAEAYT